MPLQPPQPSPQAKPGQKMGGLARPGGGPERPDPMVQPALANAMRFGRAFARMAPAGSMSGRPAMGGGMNVGAMQTMSSGMARPAFGGGQGGF